MLRALAVIAIAFTFSGCKQPLAGAFFTAQVQISGRASAGPIRSASITIFKLLPDGSRGEALATATTNSQGEYSTGFNGYVGPVEIVVSHGYYYEESSGGIVALTNEEMRARLSSLSSARIEVGITPLTEIAASRSDRLLFQGHALEATIDEANLQTSQSAGLSDILISPANPYLPLANPDSQASKYAAVLAGISQLAADSGVNSLSLTQALASDFTDGAFDGKAGINVVQISNGANLNASVWTEVDTSITKYINSGKNGAGFSHSSRPALYINPGKD